MYAQNSYVLNSYMLNIYGGVNALPRCKGQLNDPQATTGAENFTFTNAGV